MCKKFLVPFPRRIRLIVELVERFPLPIFARAHNEFRTLRIYRHRIGRVRLQLYCVRAGIRSRVDDPLRALDVLIMIAG